jgi:hypothetical protein
VVTVPSVVDTVYTSPAVKPLWLNVSTLVPSANGEPPGPLNVPPVTEGRTASASRTQNGLAAVELSLKQANVLR